LIIRNARHANHPHTIDRWDDATGEPLVEQIVGVCDYQVAAHLGDRRCRILDT
jgi:hypothetical protein